MEEIFFIAVVLIPVFGWVARRRRATSASIPRTLRGLGLKALRTQGGFEAWSAGRLVRAVRVSIPRETEAGASTTRLIIFIDTRGRVDDSIRFSSDFVARLPDSLDYLELPALAVDWESTPRERHPPVLPVPPSRIAALVDPEADMRRQPTSQITSLNVASGSPSEQVGTSCRFHRSGGVGTRVPRGTITVYSRSWVFRSWVTNA